MTEERKLAGDVEASRDPLREAHRLSLDEERAAKAGGQDDKDAAERKRAAELAATAGQTGFT